MSLLYPVCKLFENLRFLLVSSIYQGKIVFVVPPQPRLEVAIWNLASGNPDSSEQQHHIYSVRSLKCLFGIICNYGQKRQHLPKGMAQKTLKMQKTPSAGTLRF